MSDSKLLDALGELSVIVPETAELSTITRLGARHVSLSAARITAAAQMPEHAAIVEAAIQYGQGRVKKGGNRKLVAIRAVERLGVEFGRSILDSGVERVSIELDGRLAYQKTQTKERARAVVEQFAELGIASDRVLVKLPATWEGICAAEKLERRDVKCHMTLVFGMHQLAACADAGVAVVSPAVGRITDWHKKKTGTDFPPAEDPGVHAAARMYGYLRRHEYQTQLMPGMFRSADQALALAGCDSLTLPPQLLDILEEGTGAVPRQLDPDAAAKKGIDKLSIDAKKFSSMHSADPVSTSKLSMGVKNLSWALVSQEKQLVDWIIAHQDEAAQSSTATLFRVWDYDGDGYIDREEWAGADDVFNALDKDHDGRISLEEMAIGLGAPYKPEE